MECTPETNINCMSTVIEKQKNYLKNSQPGTYFSNKQRKKTQEVLSRKKKSAIQN